MTVSPSPPIRVVIVDDHTMVRKGLALFLKAFDDLELAGEAESGATAIQLCEKIQPDVVLMDLEMPVLDGYEATRQIKAGFPSCRVVALTVHGYEAARQKAMQAGADLFLAKGAAVESLVQAISARPSDPKGLGYA